MSANHKQKIILTFDVEHWSEGDWMQPYIKQEMLVNDTFPETMLSIISLLKQSKSSATFFLTQKVIDSYPEIIKRIHEDGHELGIHGPQHIRLMNYDPEIFQADCEKCIKQIETISNKRPTGYRAPHFSLNQKTRWMLPILDKLHFIYDSSIFPVKIGEYGLNKSFLNPYKISFEEIIKEDQRSKILEIPLSVFCIGNIRIPFAGGVYFRLMPSWLFQQLLRIVSKKRIPVVYLHPHDFDTKMPHIKGGSWKQRFAKYVNISRSHQKLEDLVKNFDCKSVNNCYYRVK